MVFLASRRIETPMHWNFKLILTAAWVAAGTAIYLVLPQSLPFLLPLTAVAPLLWSRREGLARRLWARSLLARLLAAASAYLLIHAIWSSASIFVFACVATLFVAGTMVHIVVITAPLIARAPLHAMAVGFYATYVVCALLASVEIIFNNPLHLYVHNTFPKLSFDLADAVVEAGVIKGFADFFLNKHIAALTFLIWPAYLVATRLGASGRSRAVLMACLTPAAVAILASSHETSKVALVGGAIVLSFHMLAPRLVAPLLAVAWAIACLAPAPIAAVAYDHGLQHARWLPQSARHRIVIWSATSTQIPEAPILGHGMGSARDLGRRTKERPMYAPGTSFRLTPGPHAHNAYLQVWLETGAVGAVLLLGIGLWAVGAASRVSADSRPALYAAFASNALLAASSFSIWASWFLASFAFSAMFAVLAWSFVTSAERAAHDVAPPRAQA